MCKVFSARKDKVRWEKCVVLLYSNTVDREGHMSSGPGMMETDRWFINITVYDQSTLQKHKCNKVPP